MDDNEKTTRREEHIYDQIDTAHANIKKDLVFNPSLTKWLQIVLLPLLTVSLLSAGLILTVVYFSMYGYEEMVKKQDPVAFVAYRNSSQSLSTGTKVLFDHVCTNVGNGYQPSTGIFAAPRAGLYHLSAVVLSGDGKQLFVRLLHNKESKSGSWVTGDGRKTGTLNVVLSLQKDDEICIVAGDSDTIYSDGNANKLLFVLLFYLAYAYC